MSQNLCTYVFVAGSKKGTPCARFCRSGKTKCFAHNKEKQSPSPSKRQNLTTSQFYFPEKVIEKVEPEKVKLEKVEPEKVEPEKIIEEIKPIKTQPIKIPKKRSFTQLKISETSSSSLSSDSSSLSSD